MLKFSWIMLCCTAQEYVNYARKFTDYAQVLTQLHVSVYASLSLWNHDMTTAKPAIHDHM